MLILKTYNLLAKVNKIDKKFHLKKEAKMWRFPQLNFFVQKSKNSWGENTQTGKTVFVFPLLNEFGQCLPVREFLRQKRIFFLNFSVFSIKRKGKAARHMTKVLEAVECNFSRKIFKREILSQPYHFHCNVLDTVTFVLCNSSTL